MLLQMSRVMAQYFPAWVDPPKKCGKLEGFQKGRDDQLKACQRRGKSIFEQGTAPELLSAPNFRSLLSWFVVPKEEIGLKNKNICRGSLFLKVESCLLCKRGEQKMMRLIDSNIMKFLCNNQPLNSILLA